MNAFKRAVKQAARSLTAVREGTADANTSVKKNIAVARNTGGDGTRQYVSATQTTRIRQDGEETFEEAHETSSFSAEGGNANSSKKHSP